ncbi:MAG: glycogen synthase [Candidatus Levybacteria bacterium]|nr:glycogen synthase [Candidatus Levybacteria bacterium]
MNILLLAAEIAPFVSVGGLSQFMYFLPKELRKLGHDVRVFTPKYGAMDETTIEGNWKMQMNFPELTVPIDNGLGEGESIICNVKSYGNKHASLYAYFLENREYFELRANVYGYRDDHTRFALLSKACLEWLLQNQQDKDAWKPDIIHCNDWHTGYFIDLARRHPRYMHAFTKMPIVYTVHNFSLQGNADFRYCRREDYDTAETLPAPLTSSQLRLQNPLKRGLLFSDAINTVSATHAVEIMTPEYAEGLDDVLQEVRGRMTGILNGLDTEKFNPHTDKTIKKQFNSNSFIHARQDNKRELQKLFGLTPDMYRPLLALSGRMVKQKGLDLLLEALPHLLTERPDVQIVFLGSGEERYRLELTVLQKNFPEQIGLHLRPDFRLPKKIFAGADMMLIPSLFEPGGIIALESLRYGCVPIVRRTGGLNDIISEFNPATKEGNGFSFKHKDAWSLYGKIMQALIIYNHQKLWKALVKNCLESDFSWSQAASQYDTWYKRVASERKATVGVASLEQKA